MTNTQKSPDRSSKSTLIVSALTLVSRLLGFVRTAVISAIFGASGVADVINLTFNIPNNFRKLLAEGALSAAFIPVLSESLIKDDGSNRGPRRITQNIITFQMLVVIPICLLCMIFAEPLVSGILAQFTVPWKIELSTNLFRWFINYLLLVSVSAAMMGSLNSKGYFFVPAVTPVLFSIFVITSIFLFHKSIGPYSMAIGVLIGGLAQIIFQAPSYIRAGYSFKLNFKFNNPDFTRILKNWLPVVITSSVFTITQTVALRFASALEVGSTSALSYAIVFWQLPMGIFSASITTVLFPKMSREFSKDDISSLRNTLSYGIRFMMVFLVPSAIFLILYGPETVSIALQRGKFSAENTYMTGQVLTAYSFGLLSVGIFNFMQRFFYAAKEYRLPFFVALFTGVLDIILSIILIETPLRVSGLAYANTISFTLGAAVYLFFARRKLKGLELKTLFITMGKVILTAIFLIIYLWFYKEMTVNWIEGFSFFTSLLYFFGGTFGAIAIVLIAYRLLKVEMLNVLFSRGKRRA